MANGRSSFIIGLPQKFSLTARSTNGSVNVGDTVLTNETAALSDVAVPTGKNDPINALVKYEPASGTLFLSLVTSYID